MTAPSPWEGGRDDLDAPPDRGPVVPIVARYSATAAYLCVMVTLILLAVVFDVRI